VTFFGGPGNGRRIGPPTTPEKNLVSFFLFHTAQLIWHSFLDSLARTCRPNGVQESCVTTGAWPIRARRSNSTPELIAAIVEANRAIIARIEHTFYYSVRPVDSLSHFVIRILWTSLFPTPCIATVSSSRLQSCLLWQEEQPPRPLLHRYGHNTRGNVDAGRDHGMFIVSIILRLSNFLIFNM
jgi:hypothetical protein